MICYLCATPIADGEAYYNDHEKYVCKPCFNDAQGQRCFVCRFPGRHMEPVTGLGLECEFCRGRLIGEDSDTAGLLAPLGAYLEGFGMRAVPRPRLEWRDVRELREMQTRADVAPPEFVDDFLRYAYPVYHRDGVFHLLRRMTRETFVAYMVVQMAAVDVAGRFGLPDLAGRTPFHTFARGWCHWLGHEAAGLLGYDLQRRWLRKWPELGGQGEFERWERMARVNKRARLREHFHAAIGPLARKHLGEGARGPEAGGGR